MQSALRSLQKFSLSLFQKRVVCTKFDIYVFIIQDYCT
jgi:hypothetical protein